jgi:colicin import membrane protein
MEPNELTCPQCGLVNNYLSQTCAQCGIIFVKNSTIQAQAEENNPTMQAPAEQDEQKRKAIEEAEAILRQSDPAAGNDLANNEPVTRPDSVEDTIEMEIPGGNQTFETRSETASADGTQPEENQKPTHHEIELEAIETSIEMIDPNMDAEELFLSEVKPGKPAETQKPEAIEKPADSPTHPKTAGGHSDKTMESDAVENEKKDGEKDDTALKQTEAEPWATTQPQEDQKKMESEEAKSEVAEPDKADATELTKAKTAAAEISEPGSTEDKPNDTAQPSAKDIHLEEKQELTMVKDEPVQDKAQTHADATIEMSGEPAEENVPAKNLKVKAQDGALKKQKEIQVREALKKHRETQAKTEALKKEKAAQAKAAALKMKKLDRVKVEALKKQKAAQAKAEALKKRKEAQAKAKAVKKQKTAQARAEALKKQKEAQDIAEASAPEMQVASGGVQEAASQTTGESLNTHEKLLGLLKRYKGKAIGINYDNSTEIKEAELIEANEEFFSVMVKDKKLQYSYPLKSILTIIEGQEGVETGQDEKKLKFDAVIKVYPLVSF